MQDKTLADSQRSSALNPDETKRTSPSKAALFNRAFSTRTPPRRPLSRPSKATSTGTSSESLTLNCDMCGAPLHPGLYSFRRRQYLCNYPCFVKLIYGLLKSHTLAPSHPLTDLVQHLELYNSHWSNADDFHHQMSTIDFNDSVQVEGSLVVHWNIYTPIVIEGLKRSSTTKLGANVKDVTYVNFKKARALIPSVVLSKNHDPSYATVLRVPPKHATPISITSKQNPIDVIHTFFTSYGILNEPSCFSLYLVSHHRGRRKILDNEYPLLIRLKSGPIEDQSKIFIMNANEENISKEAAQYFGLSETLLQAFLDNIDKEEHEQVSFTEQIYTEYSQALVKIINNSRKIGALLDDIFNLRD